jgi:hypothetical protein
MSKQSEPLDVPFAERDFTTSQTMQILAVGKTKFFEGVLPQLESYLDGSKRKITGRSIQKYRERRLAEPRKRNPADHLFKARATADTAGAA